MDDPRFPSDVKQRAKLILEGCRGGSVGAYTDSVGIEIIRNHVAKFIERRDGIPSDPANIVLSAGASDGIKVRALEISLAYKTRISSQSYKISPLRQNNYSRFDSTVTFCQCLNQFVANFLLFFWRNWVVNRYGELETFDEITSLRSRRENIQSLRENNLNNYTSFRVSEYFENDESDGERKKTGHHGTHPAIPVVLGVVGWVQHGADRLFSERGFRLGPRSGRVGEGSHRSETEV